MFHFMLLHITFVIDGFCAINSILFYTIQGYMNAKVEPDAFEQWAGTIGRFGMREVSERGERLLEFAHMHEVTLRHILFPHKISGKRTWRSHDGVTHNQIDNILSPLRFKSPVSTELRPEHFRARRSTPITIRLW